MNGGKMIDEEIWQNSYLSLQRNERQGKDKYSNTDLKLSIYPER